ncbi:hypothetical protein [Streptomyces sp. NPDC020362]|uniref:hypothetical protein n=1 Tax=unclassified Streptomyces TaxID=2593676 RepID=UPI00340283BB
MGYVDTDMTADIEAPKASAHDIAVAALDGVETGAYEVLGDDLTRWAKAALSEDVAAVYQLLAAATPRRRNPPGRAAHPGPGTIRCGTGHTPPCHG